ncbi:MAG: DUF6491 family protein [Pseudomonadota bacterium]
MKALRNVVLGTMIAGCAGLLAAAEKAPEKAAETSIPFVNLEQSIHGWQADGQMGLWIQDAHKNWYYAKFIGPCIGLEFAPQLGFEPKTMNSLDKFGNVIVPNSQRCAMSSLTKSDAPPKEKKAGKTGATK